MGLDIWFSDDIHNALLAANEASASTAVVVAEAKELPELLTVTLRAYREGYKAALSTVALAFGLSPAIITGHQRDIPEVSDDEEATESTSLVIPTKLLLNNNSKTRG